MPFLALHLRSSGVPDATLGLLLASMPIARILTTPLWAWLGDRTGRGTLLLQIAAFTSVGGAALTLGSPPIAVLTLGLAVWAATRGPIGPLLDAQAVTLLERRDGHADGYGRLRLWGSLGFLAGGWAAGLRAEADPSFPTRLALGLWLLGAFLTLGLPRDVRAVPAAPGPALRVLMAQPWCFPLLAGCLLHGAALTAYDGLYALRVAELGLPSRWTGAALVAGVAAETALMAAGGFLLRRFGARRLILAGMAVGVLRWGLTAVLRDPWLLTAAQLLHGVSFGAWWIGGVEHMRRSAGPEIRASAQSLFTVAGYGLGGVASGLVASVLLPRVGASGLFLAGAAASALGLLVAGWGLRRG